MAETNFCCRSGGSNLNAGTRDGSTNVPGTAADFTYLSGNWVAGTGVFTVASGNPLSDGVAVGDFASVYADGSSETGFIGRVTARDSTTITVSLTAKAGTAPTNGTGNRTLKIGGAWQGPNGSIGFPFGFIGNALTNAAGDRPCVNFKNDAAYNITAAMTHSIAGPVRFQGFSSTYGDGGRATIDGGASGSGYVLLTLSASNNAIADLVFSNNGASGSAVGVVVSGNFCVVAGCVFHDVRLSGLAVYGTGVAIVECEAYSCNQANTSNNGGFQGLGILNYFNSCVSHDNSGSNSVGFFTNNDAMFVRCIAESNGNVGFVASGCDCFLDGCDSYGNGSHGLSVGRMATVRNSNFIANGGYGISGPGTGSPGIIQNCGFGSGTMANASGATNAIGPMIVSGSVTYPTNQSPYQDSAAGNFSIVLAEAKAAGRGAFTQTQSGYGGTIGYPSIGAAQADASAGGGTGSIFSSPIIRGVF